MDIQREAFKLEVSELDSFDLHEFTLSPFEWNEEDQKFYFKPTQLLWEVWQAKAQAVPKWISVEEALPPGNILVLAMAQTFSNVFNVYNVMALDEFQESDITHWMPLPDAPREPTND